MIALARPCDAHLLERLDRALAHHSAVDLGVLQQYVFDLAADLADRIERQPRRLEDHRHFTPAQVAHLAFRHRAQVEPAEGDGAFGDLAGAVEDAHHRIGGDRLAGARFTDNGQRLAFGDGEIDMLDRAHGAAPRGELDGEVMHREQRQRTIVFLEFARLCRGF